MNIRIIVAFRVVFLSCFGLDWMRKLHNEHHLAAKSGTVFCLFWADRSSVPEGSLRGSGFLEFS